MFIVLESRGASNPDICHPVSSYVLSLETFSVSVFSFLLSEIFLKVKMLMWIISTCNQRYRVRSSLDFSVLDVEDPNL